MELTKVEENKAFVLKAFETLFNRRDYLHYGGCGLNSFLNSNPSERIGSVRFFGVVNVGPFGQYQITQPPATLAHGFEM